MMLAILMTITTILNNFFIALLFLCWGSFLNVMAYRLLHGVPFFGARSRCPHCNKIIAWYDLIPIISWFVLRARCRQCTASISWLYPLIETITFLSLWGLYLFVSPHYWLAYGLFFSALVVTIRTDLEEMVILRPFSLGILPLGLIFSFFGLLPITFISSLLGAFLGFALLGLARHGYYAYAGEHGMGNGDPELLAAIGAFVGPTGCWLALLTGSFLGSCLGLGLFIAYGAAARKKPLPFGPFLAIGAFIVVIFQEAIMSFVASL